MKKTKKQEKPVRKASPAIKPLFYRAKDLAGALGISKTTLWRLWKRGILPPPTKLGRGIAGWPASEIEVLIASPRAAEDE